MKIISLDEHKNHLRKRRATECFSIVNRGQVWYDCLRDDEKAELKQWYIAWLNVTETDIVPEQPKWLTNKLEQEEILW